MQNRKFDFVFPVEGTECVFAIWPGRSMDDGLCDSDALKLGATMKDDGGHTFELFAAGMPFADTEAAAEAMGKLMNTGRCYCILYKDGIVIAASAVTAGQLELMSAKVLSALRGTVPAAVIGVSDVYDAGGSVSRAEYQAVTARRAAVAQKLTSLAYSVSGTYKLLLPLKDDKCLREMCDDTLGVLAEYDKQNGSQLLSTLLKFYEYGGNYKMIANELFQHENTIRFRIVRAKKLVGIPSMFEFIESIGVAIKIARLLGLYGL